MNQPFVQTAGIDNFKFELYDRDLQTYDFIYISLGSKFNQYHIQYTMPYNKIIHKISNAEFQMIPAFCRNKPDKKILSICIDRFETANTKQENIDILAKILDHEPNIEMILCDLDGTVQLFETIIQFIIEQIEKCTLDQSLLFDEKKMAIVNYINFISPNHTEYYLEQKISETIHKIICNTRFHDSFYQWFGYQPNLYNFIYKYKAQYISYGMTFLCDILQKSIGNEELTIYNKDKVIHSINCSRNRELYEMFFKNVRDICHTDSYL